MKKNMLLITAFIFLFNIEAFSKSGFAVILNVPVGLSVGIPIGVNQGETLNKIGINTGVNVKLGYLFDLGKFGVTPLLELGYSYDTYAYSIFLKNNIVGTSRRISISETINTHSIQVGLIPKLNIENFAIGLGFGVKIPLYLIIKQEGVMSEGNNNVNQEGETIISHVDRKGIENRYSRDVIPYIKLSFDYYFFFTEKLSVAAGAYIGYDFGFPSKSSLNERLDSLDITAQIGLRFGPNMAE